METYYTILEINPNATGDVIKCAYRKLAKQYHPDVWTGDEAFATQRMAKINKAYSHLINPKQRELYDEILKYKSRVDGTDYRSSQYKESGTTSASGTENHRGHTNATHRKTGSGIGSFVLNLFFVIYTLGDLYIFGGLFLICLFMAVMFPLSILFGHNDTSTNVIFAILSPFALFATAALGHHLKDSCSVVYDNIGFIHNIFEPFVTILGPVFRVIDLLYVRVTKKDSGKTSDDK